MWYRPTSSAGSSWRNKRFSARSRRRDLNRSAMKIAAAHKIVYISFDDGPICLSAPIQPPDEIFGKDKALSEN